MNKWFMTLGASLIGVALLALPATEATATTTINETKPAQPAPVLRTYKWLNQQDIRIGGKVYTLSKRDQQFLRQNKQALQRAKLAIVESKSPKAIEIVGLELNTSGKSSTRTVTLDGMGRTFKGDIHVNAKNVKLQDIKQVENILLTKQATATTQLVEVTATTLKQQATKRILTKHTTPSTNIVLNGSRVEYLDMVQPQTRLYIRDRSTAAHIRTFVESEIRASANAGMIVSLMTGNYANSLHVNAKVNRFANYSHELKLSGDSTMKKVDTTSDRGQLISTMTGTIDQLDAHGTAMSLTFTGKLDLKRLNAFGYPDFGHIKLSSEQQIEHMTSNMYGATVEIDAPLQKLTLRDRGTVTLKNKAKINQLRAEDNLTLNGTGSVRKLVATNLADTLSLNSPISEFIVRHNADKPMVISGTTSISSVMLDGSGPVTIDLPTIGSIAGTETNTSTVDLKNTLVEVNNLPDHQVIAPRPESPSNE